MGCCLGRDLPSLPESEDESPIAVGKGRPLLRHRIKWRSEHTISENQLGRKRAEFWETAPCFEGRKEIWDALRAAATHAEHGDWPLAQAILDGANISLPDGTLRESYDELGSRYQVPIYCLSKPHNLTDEASRRSSSVDQSVAISDQKRKDKNANNTKPGQPLTIRLRLSITGEDLKMDVRTNDLIREIKRKLHETVPERVPDFKQQRWYFGGRMLADKMTIEQCKVPAHFVIQVVIREAVQTEPDTEKTVEPGTEEKPTSSSGLRIVMVEPKLPEPESKIEKKKRKSSAKCKIKSGSASTRVSKDTASSAV